MSADDLDPVYATLRATAHFVWANLVSVVGISVCWFLAALPVVTIGPATVGAYAAVLSLREDRDASVIASDGVDRSAVTATVREQFVHATLIGLVPLVLVGIAASYAGAYLATSALAPGLLALAGVNAAAYAALVSIPTLLGLAQGDAVADAVTGGYVWTARHAVGAVALGVVTAALLAAASVLTIAVIVLFAGVAAAFHVEFVTGVAATDETLSPAPRP